MSIHKKINVREQILNIAVVIPIYLEYKLTVEAILQLYSQTKLLNINLMVIIVDSSESQIPENKIRKKINKIDMTYHHIHVSKKHYWNASVQKGLKYIVNDLNVKPDVVLVMNNDVEISKDYVKKSLEIMIQNNFQCLVSGVTIEHQCSQVFLEAGYRGIYSMTPNRIYPNEIEKKESKFEYPDYLAFRCILLPARILYEGQLAINSWALPHYWADIFMSFRAKLSGFRLIVSSEIFIRHKREPAVLNQSFSLFSQFFHPKSYRRIVSILFFWNMVTYIYLRSKLTKCLMGLI